MPSTDPQHLLTLPQGIFNTASPPSRGRSGLETTGFFGGAGVICFFRAKKWGKMSKPSEGSRQVLICFPLSFSLSFSLSFYPFPRPLFLNKRLSRRGTEKKKRTPLGVLFQLSAHPPPPFSAASLTFFLLILLAIRRRRRRSSNFAHLLSTAKTTSPPCHREEEEEQRSTFVLHRAPPPGSSTGLLVGHFIPFPN